jgi:hypothetical protein
MKKKAFLILSGLAVHATAYAKGVIGYQYRQQLGTPVSSVAPSSLVDISLTDQGKSGGSGYFYQLDGRLQPEESTGLYSVPEAYLSRTNGRTSYVLGRKILDWNAREAFWATGELNSMRGFNGLESNQEGIVGAHFKRGGERFAFHFYASPVSIPQINPSYTQQKDGKISGTNEWANLPPERVRFRGQEIPVRYDIEYPEVSEIIFHPSAGINLDWKLSSWNFNAYGAYKPENQIRINATGDYVQDAEGERAEVRARPFIAYHRLYGAGVSKELGRGWSAGTGLMIVDPVARRDDKFVFEALRVEPVYTEEHYATAAFTWQGRDLTFSLEALELTKGRVVNTNAFAKKPKWTRAVGTNVRWSPRDRFALSGQWRRDLLSDDVTWRTEAEWQLSRHLTMGLGFELIDAPNDASFWSAYRANDGLFGSLGYLF